MSSSTRAHDGQNWFGRFESLIHGMNVNPVEAAVIMQHGRPRTAAGHRAASKGCGMCLLSRGDGSINLWR